MLPVVHLVTPSTAKVTDDTPTLSLAEAAMVIVPETVEPFAGEVMVMSGAAASTVQVKLVLALPPLPSATVTCTG